MAIISIIKGYSSQIISIILFALFLVYYYWINKKTQENYINTLSYVSSPNNVNQCQTTWGDKISSKCTNCYDPRYVNNDVQMYGEDTTFVELGQKICKCEPCSNTQLLRYF